MKRLAVVAVLLAVACAPVEALALPKPISMGERQKGMDSTHAVRGDARKLPTPRRLGIGGSARAFNSTHGVRGR
ncbi:MAG TPA: hypothetical protein VGB87_15350 [Vicinamibacteria bacterium]